MELGMRALMAWAAAAASVAMAGPASAGVVEQVHAGVLDHNIRVIDEKNANKEDGVAIEAQVNFASPELLDIIWSPQPYVVGSVNTEGNLAFAGFGLEWRVPIGDYWSVEPGVGYVVHDGELSNPYPNGDPRATAFSDENVLLGSRDLFRTSIGLSRRIGDRVSAQLFFSHLSHGQILGSGRNQGMDQAGLRLGYRLGD
jgi:lipid A 3-O-deacylase